MDANLIDKYKKNQPMDQICTISKIIKSINHSQKERRKSWKGIRLLVNLWLLYNICMADGWSEEASSNTKLLNLFA